MGDDAVRLFSTFILCVLLTGLAFGSEYKTTAKYDIKVYNNPTFKSDTIGKIKGKEVVFVIDVTSDQSWVKIKSSKKANMVGWVAYKWLNIDEKVFKDIAPDLYNTPLSKDIQQEIKDLEKEISLLGKNEFGAHRYLYEELSKLNPKNKDYSDKVSYYAALEKKYNIESRLKNGYASKQYSSDQESCDLKLLNWYWSSERNYVTAEGQVKNISGKKLKGVVALVTWYDNKKNMVTSDTGFLEYNPIMPGQISPFKVTERYNPAMKSATIEFKYFAGGRISTYREKE